MELKDIGRRREKREAEERQTCGLHHQIKRVYK